MRRPVEIQGRAGAAPGETQNRAQYLRPALDNQNSRMLAKAFSQINSSLGRIASNEARLAERRRNDEFKQASEYHDQQLEMAQQLGALSAQTGEDYKDQFWNTPAALMAYNESNIVGRTDRSLVEFMLEAESGPLFGDPNQREALQSEWTDFATHTLKNTPPELQGEVAARLSKAGTDMLVKSDALAVENALAEIQGNATSAVRRGFLMSETAMELSAELLFEREALVKVHGNKRGNEMFITALTTDMANIVRQVKPETAQIALDQMAELISNEDFTKQFGSGEGGAIEQITNAHMSAQRELAGYVKGLEEQAAAEHAKAGMELTRAAMADWSNMNNYRDDFIAHYGMEEGRKKFMEMEQNFRFLEGASFMPDTNHGRTISAQNLRELKNELDESNFTAEELVEWVTSRQGMVTEDDWRKLQQYAPKVPEAMDHPVVKGLLADTAAMADFAALVINDTEQVEVLKIGEDPSKSAIANAYKAYIRDHIEQNADAYNEALRNGTVDKFMNTLANDAAAYILDYNFGGDEEFTTLRSHMENAIRNRSNVLDLSNNVAFRRYFANEEMIRQVEEQEALAEQSAANNPDLDRLESMVDDSIGISEQSEADTLEQNLGADNPAAAMSRFTETMNEALGDDDGDGIINSREDLFTRERVGRRINREDLGIDNVETPTQSNGKKVNASVRTFNFGAIGEMYSGDVEKKFEKAFGRGYESITLKASDDNPIKTPKFDTPEEGVQYFGFWLKHRGEPRTISKIIDKYATGSPAAYKKHVAKLTGIGQGDTLTDDQLAEVAVAMFDWEAGTGSNSAAMVGDIMAEVDVKENILKGMKMYEDS